MRYRNLLVATVVAGLLGLAGGLSCELFEEVKDVAECDGHELNLAANHVGDFGDTEAAQKIESFFWAVDAVENRSQELASRLVAACKAIGAAVGLSDAELSPTAGETGDAARINAACGPKLQERIKETIQAALPRGARITLTYEPPVCSGDFDAYANCAAECDVDVNPGELEVNCKPGTIGIGRCQAGCRGQCRVAADAHCRGSCSATCSGRCSGPCYGTCNGDPINGTICTGQCEGRCGGTCEGRCSGTCVFDATGSCDGECHGECDVWIGRPRCEVYAEPPGVEAECHTSCQARVSANLRCTEPQLLIDYGVLGGSPQAQERFENLVNALRVHYPKVLVAAQETGEEMVRLVDSFFDALDAFADGLGALLDAAACAVVALDVSAQVTLTFQASASACGGIAGSVAVQGGAVGI